MCREARRRRCPETSTLDNYCEADTPMPFADPALRTTTVLRQWENGSTTAEHLCADILRLEGFSAIDPQLPVGGPDGGKDILCEKQGVEFVGAAYFPTNDVTFARIRKKFRDDIKGATPHGRSGFIFLTNQKLSPAERIELENIAAAAGMTCLLYNRDRLRVALDSPAGYGIRLRHLRIELLPEEQFAYFAAAENGVVTALEVNTRALQSLTRRIDNLSHQQSSVALATVAVIKAAVQRDDEGADVARMLQAAATLATADAAESPSTGVSASLSSELVRYIHRLLLWPTSPAIAGRYRQTQVFLVDPTGAVAEAMECPPWDQVPGLVDALVVEWNAGQAARMDDPDAALTAIARFFRDLLHIHPFTDGNGRLARELMSLQVRELLGHEGDLLLDHGPAYFHALRAADAGIFQGLEELISDAMQLG